VRRAGLAWWSASILLLSAVVLAGAACTGNGPADVRQLDQIAAAYEIEIVTGDPGLPAATAYGMIGGDSADRAALRRYVGLFAAEFTLYPPSLVKRARLRRVVLCTGLTFAGEHRTAIPDYEHDTLYLDVSAGSYDKAYIRAAIHHEFFHIVDYQDDGEVYRDERWAALNPPGFKYGSGGRSAQSDSNMSVLTDKWPGFLTHYATTGVEEDKAETFAHMIVHAGYVALRAKADPVLRAKVQRMKELVVVFCPDMTEGFWDRARNLRRADD
jgi:hypothetical protein